MKLDFPATGRNSEAILGVLRGVLPPEGLVLEIASGSGQHTAAFAPALPQLRFQPTDLEPPHLASIDAWCAELPNVAPAQRLDVVAPWPVQRADAVLCINMVHISPWRCTEALLAGAAAVLPAGGPLFLYGPFQRDGAHTSPSNARFHASLQSRDPSWGVRDLGAVIAAAAQAGLAHTETLEMPANNLSVVFRTG